MNIQDLHLKLRPPVVILVVDMVKSLNDLLETGDELLFALQLQQRATNLPVDDRRVEHQVVISTNIKQQQNDVLFLHFNGHFSAGPGLVGTRMSPSWFLLEPKTIEVVTTTGAIRCAKLQSNHHRKQTNTQFLTGRMPLLSPDQQCQSNIIMTFCQLPSVAFDTAAVLWCWSAEFLWTNKLTYAVQLPTMRQCVPMCHTAQR